MTVKPIRTAVFPVAGRGTRFLPATKASPKEMLPVVDKPLIQYAVEEAIAVGEQCGVHVENSTASPGLIGSQIGLNIGEKPGRFANS